MAVYSITTTDKQDAAVTSVASAYNAENKVTLSNEEYLQFVMGNVFDRYVMQEARKESASIVDAYEKASLTEQAAVKLTLRL